MNYYFNSSGNSGVHTYEIGFDYIIVQFNDGAVYKYSYASAGARIVEQMKILAQQGYGLHSYINKYAYYKYER